MGFKVLGAIITSTPCASRYRSPLGFSFVDFTVRTMDVSL